VSSSRGAHIVHCPLGEFMGSLPRDGLLDGMLVVPTKRIVPTPSLRGSRPTVVPV
jgi:hypothetical protein